MQQASYNTSSEAASRVAVNTILIETRAYLYRKYYAKPDAEAGCTTGSSKSAISPMAQNPLTPNTRVKTKRTTVFPEHLMSITMEDTAVRNRAIRVTGRADWAVGYGKAKEESTFLVAIVAKSRAEFSSGESQLIAYLAILREHRRRDGKTNVITQGFYSDGERFVFICITADGLIERSVTYEIARGDLDNIFSFIVAIMETSMKSTPNTSPTKKEYKREKEINQFMDEVWLESFMLS